MALSPQAAFEYLQRAHDQQRLGHAYLISGPPGSGKRQLAAQVTALVNATAAADVFSARAREVYIAEPESKSRRIVIEQIRELEHSLQMRAAGDGRKVAIIAEADRLQPQAANAFLKTLEEPPSNSLLLLLSALPEVLPDTILSRCISIPLAADEAAQPEEQRALVDLLRELAQRRSWNVETAYGLAQGIQRLLGSIRDEIKQKNEENQKQEEARYKNSTDGSWLDDREDYYKALTESQYIHRRARLLEVLFLWWTDVLRAKTGVSARDFSNAKKETAELADRFKTPEILKRIRRLEEMRNHLGYNIQEALAIEVAFLKVFGA
ncbi:MAG TPA: AAA family ATPase [Chthoniobacterales bacterium]|nr:AAA family ATPase [Chthoniobacterales bacterium]